LRTTGNLRSAFLLRKNSEHIRYAAAVKRAGIHSIRKCHGIAPETHQRDTGLGNDWQRICEDALMHFAECRQTAN